MPQQALLSARKQQLVLRIHVLEKEAIAIKAKKAGLSKSEYLRQAALQANTSPKTLLAQTDLCHLLVEYRDHLALIKDLIEQRKDFTIKLHELIEKINHIVNHLPT